MAKNTLASQKNKKYNENNVKLKGNIATKS